MRWILGAVLLLTLALLAWLVGGPEWERKARRGTTAEQSEERARPSGEEQGESRTDVRPDDQLGYPLRVHVVGQDDRPLSELRVRLLDKSRKPPFVAEAPTNSDGKAVFADVREESLVVLVEGIEVGQVFPRKHPDAKFILDVNPVTFEVQVDGRPGVPPKFEIEGVVLRSIDALAGRVEAWRLAKGPNAKFSDAYVGVSAPRFIPVLVNIGGDAPTVRMSLKRGLRVRIQQGDYVPVVIVDTKGTRFRPVVGDQYDIPVGRWELRTKYLNTFLGHLDVTEADRSLYVQVGPAALQVYRNQSAKPEHYPLPRTTKIRHGGELRPTVSVLAKVEDEARSFSRFVGRVVLPPGKSVAFTLRTGVLEPKPKPQVVTQYVSEVVFRDESVIVRFDCNFSTVFTTVGGFVVFRAGDRTKPVSRGSAWPTSISGDPRFAAHCIAPPGRYDIWIDAGQYVGRWIEGVEIGPDGADLGRLEFRKGIVVVLPRREGEDPGRLQSLDRPFETPRFVEDSFDQSAPLLFLGCSPGSYEWTSGKTKLRIDVPAGVKRYTVPR